MMFVRSSRRLATRAKSQSGLRQAHRAEKRDHRHKAKLSTRIKPTS